MERMLHFFSFLFGLFGSIVGSIIWSNLLAVLEGELEKEAALTGGRGEGRISSVVMSLDHGVLAWQWLYSLKVPLGYLKSISMNLQEGLFWALSFDYVHSDKVIS